MNKPAERDSEQLILEGLVTTHNADGSVNISPMGPVVDRSVTTLRLRPFSTSTTYANLARSGHGVFHVTDDVDLLVRSALGMPTDDTDLQSIAGFDGSYILGACRWYAFDVVSIDDATERIEIECNVVSAGRLRDFLGWNRAMHAVLEATILATRLSMLPKSLIVEELARLEVVIHKTASQQERKAFQVVRNVVEDYEGA